jgi:hypothetical protein
VSPTIAIQTNEMISRRRWGLPRSHSRFKTADSTRAREPALQFAANCPS